MPDSTTLEHQLEEAHDLIAEFGDSVTDMFEQMNRGEWKDNHGHDVRLNVAMMALMEVVKEAIKLRQVHGIVDGG